MSSDLDNNRLAVLVHEVRSPVAALSAVAETVDESSLDGAMRRELVKLALAACRGIERIVLDLAVSSIRVEPVDVGALAHDAVASFAVRGANVVAEVPTGQLRVDGDPVRLRQVLDNLIANALDHGEASSHVVVRVLRSEQSVQLAVCDEGSGIPTQELARIFELGVRLDDSASGSGIGLALARAIVEAHSGRLEVESTLDTGSTFTIVLPSLSSQPAT
jgi:signal transduction histidine kinase